MSKLLIVTSGWSYNHWKEIFYPKDLASEKWLSFYAETFPTVEINNSFYHLPSRETFETWRAQTPPDFVFAVKASRFITHLKKLKEVEEPLNRLLTNALGLGAKLGPFLFQFPPNWNKNAERLKSFLAILPPNRKFVFEFRNETWFDREIFQLLRAKNAALCITSSPDFPSSKEITTPFTFIRMHGGKELYGSNYSERELRIWAKLVSRLLEEGIAVYVYFNNDAYGYAVKNAVRLREILGM